MTTRAERDAEAEGFFDADGRFTEAGEVWHEATVAVWRVAWRKHWAAQRFFTPWLTAVLVTILVVTAFGAVVSIGGSSHAALAWLLAGASWEVIALLWAWRARIKRRSAAWKVIESRIAAEEDAIRRWRLMTEAERTQAIRNEALAKAGVAVLKAGAKAGYFGWKHAGLLGWIGGVLGG